MTKKIERQKVIRKIEEMLMFLAKYKREPSSERNTSDEEIDYAMTIVFSLLRSVEHMRTED